MLADHGHRVVATDLLDRGRDFLDETQLLFAGKDPESEPEVDRCIVCRSPLPSTARGDARLCSATCRQRARRRGMAQRRTA